jgi:heptosyltransferase-2
LAGFFARNGILDTALSEYFSSFHIILSYLYDPDGLFRDNLMRVSTAQIIPGPHRPDDSSPRHAALQLLAPLERLAIFDSDPQPRIAWNAANSPTRRLAVHPGSGGERKNWPEGSWASLLSRWLAFPGREILLVGGEAERDRLDRLERLFGGNRIQTARSLPLNTLVELLGNCSGFVGHDSGISHLAAACGLPGLVIWGPTEAKVWRPYSSLFELLPAPAGLATLPVETVFSKLDELWTRWVA